MDYQTEYINKNPQLHLEQSEVKAGQVLNFLGNGTVNSLLDLACGAGKITTILAENLKSRRTVGLDISKKMIEVAKKTHGTQNIKWIAKDIFTYFPKEKFELVTCIDILEHVEDDLALLLKVRTLGKMVLIKVPMEHSFLENRIIRASGLRDPWKESEEKYGHIHHYNEQQLNGLFAKAGFKVLKQGYISLPKRSLLFYEVFRIIFLPIGWFSQKAMAKFVGGFKIVLLTE